MLYELGRHQIELPGIAPVSDAQSKIILWYQGQILTQDRQIAWAEADVPYPYMGREFVGLLDGKAYFTASVSQVSADQSLSSLRDIAYLDETAFMLCARSRGLLEWRAQHQYCGQCGQVTHQIAGENALSCSPCRLRFYPRISPCIIVLITRGDQVLLAQGENHKERGWYSTLAGFIESGESAEQAVMREVKEEVGVTIKNIQYLNSQAWPFPNQLMLGFHAEFEAGEIVPAPGEIADAQWFNIHDLPKHPPSVSIAGWLIRQYIDNYRA